jgi:hypothetical protein
MFLFFVSFVSAETVATDATDPLMTAHTACVATVRAEFEAGPVYPSRIATAKLKVGDCGAEARLIAQTATTEQIAAAWELRALKLPPPALPSRTETVVRVETTDSWVADQIERGIAALQPQPEPVDPRIAEVSARIEAAQSRSMIANSVVKANDAEIARYDALAKGLYQSYCAGVIDLPPQESYGVDVRVTPQRCMPIVDPMVSVINRPKGQQ